MPRLFRPRACKLSRPFPYTPKKLQALPAEMHNHICRFLVPPDSAALKCALRGPRASRALYSSVESLYFRRLERRFHRWVACGYGDSARFNQVWFNDLDGYVETGAAFWNRIVSWLLYSLPLTFIQSLPPFIVDVRDISGCFLSPAWGHRAVAYVVIFVSCPATEHEPQIIVLNGRASVLRAQRRPEARYKHHG